LDAFRATFRPSAVRQATQDPELELNLTGVQQLIIFYAPIMADNCFIFSIYVNSAMVGFLADYPPTAVWPLLL
jgi:hypothetical protein